MKGLASGGVLGSIIFHLPKGYRPESGEYLFSSGLSRVDVKNEGYVVHWTGEYAVLDGISFLAAQ
ncbi:hypothetical protein D3C76_1829320 [compost metagenome]